MITRWRCFCASIKNPLILRTASINCIFWLGEKKCAIIWRFPVDKMEPKWTIYLSIICTILDVKANLLCYEKKKPYCIYPFYSHLYITLLDQIPANNLNIYEICTKVLSNAATYLLTSYFIIQMQYIFHGEVCQRAIYFIISLRKCSAAST